MQTEYDQVRESISRCIETMSRVRMFSRPQKIKYRSILNHLTNEMEKDRTTNQQPTTRGSSDYAKEYQDYP